MVKDELISEFLEDLASSAPTPGGGGASALAAATACSLGSMVCNLTIGKKKYAAYEEDLKNDLEKLSSLQEAFYTLADKDEEVFLPLSKGYKMPRDTEEEKKIRDAYMEIALLDASNVPMQVMELTVEAANVIGDLAEKGSVLSVSDAGCAAAFLESALKGAILNVKINEKSMKDENTKNRLHEKSEFLLKTGLQKIQAAYQRVTERLS